MVTETTADKINRALNLLAEQRVGLAAAIETWQRDPSAYGRQQLRAARQMLARVAVHEREMARNPEFFAGLTLGFMGDNGYAPLCRIIISDAQNEAARRVAA